jgi:hypothetical protein
MGEKLATYMALVHVAGARAWVPEIQGCHQLGFFLAEGGLRQQAAAMVTWR